MFYSFFWMIHRRLNFMYRRFRTLCLLHLHRLCRQKECHPGYYSCLHRLLRWNKKSVPKLLHIKFRSRGIVPKRIQHFSWIKKIYFWNGAIVNVGKWRKYPNCQSKHCLKICHLITLSLLIIGTISITECCCAGCITVETAHVVDVKRNSAATISAAGHVP
jgi:hypothetical protein